MRFGRKSPADEEKERQETRERERQAALERLRRAAAADADYRRQVEHQPDPGPRSHGNR